VSVSFSVVDPQHVCLSFIIIWAAIRIQDGDGDEIKQKIKIKIDEREPPI
jgi:hypothetical protein